MSIHIRTEIVRTVNGVTAEPEVVGEVEIPDQNAVELPLDGHASGHTLIAKMALNGTMRIADLHVLPGLADHAPNPDALAEFADTVTPIGSVTSGEEVASFDLRLSATDVAHLVVQNTVDQP